MSKKEGEKITCLKYTKKLKMGHTTEKLII